MANFLKGIDVAHWEPVIKWEMLRKQDIHFAFIKATEGLQFVDPKFAEHWANAKQAGILRGAYHFLRPDVDGGRQAEFFLRTVNFEPGDLPPVLDLEDIFEEVKDEAPGKKKVKGKQGKGETGGRPGKRPIIFPPAQIIKCVEDWLKTVEDRTGSKPIIYSRASYLVPNLSISGKPPSWSMDHRTWLAHYKELPENTLPDEATGWQEWSFWQYSQHSNVDGILDEIGRLTGVDMNYFRGTLAELYALAGTTPPADSVVEQAQPVEPQDVVEVKVVIPVETPPGETQDAAEVKVVISVETPPVETPVAVTMTYSIKAGDTINGLAAKFKTTPEAILAANPQITNPDFIRIGDTLTIPRA
jgi:lysozyme